MAEHESLFVEDLVPGKTVPGGRVADGLGVSQEQFTRRYGKFFWSPPGAIDPVYFKLASFCKTTAVSENSPANLGATNVIFHRQPTSLDVPVETSVLGRKYRAPRDGEQLQSGVVQVESVVGGDDPVLRWSRECVVNAREGSTVPESLWGTDDRRKLEPGFPLSEVEIPASDGAAIPDAALRAGRFRVGDPVYPGRIAVLEPEDVFWITEGLGNLAHTHYTRDSGFIVWGWLTGLYGLHNHQHQLGASILLGFDIAKHTGPVYLTEKIRELEHATPGVPEPPEYLWTTLVPRTVEPIPGRDDVRLVVAELHVHVRINAIGQQEYASRAAKSVRANIEDGQLLVGRYDLRMATFV